MPSYKPWPCPECGFDPGKEPGWSDLTPYPDCQVTRDQYPDPRSCAARTLDEDYDGPCHLGHPANCRRLMEAVAHERHLTADKRGSGIWRMIET